MLAVESDKDLGNRGPGSRGGPPKGDFPEEWLPREVHRKCNDAENQTGGNTRRQDSNRSIQSQKEDPMHTTVCKGDFRQDSEHLQEGRSTSCVPTEVHTEGSTHKSEGTTEAQRQGCGVIPCAQCDQVYIGETGRPLKTRISEHKRAVATGDVRNANATHWIKTNHNMNWGAAHVVDRSNRWKERKIKESVYIRTRRTYNMDLGSSLSPVWNSLIRHLKEYIVYDI